MSYSIGLKLVIILLLICKQKTTAAMINLNLFMNSMYDMF